YFRHMAPWQLIKIAIALMLVPTVIVILMSAGLQLLPEQRIAELTVKHWLPSREVIREAISLYTGNWLATAGARALNSLTIQAWMLVTERFWKVLALMLIGMALLRIGFLMGRSSGERYRRLGLASLAIGLPIVALGVAFHGYFYWPLRYSLYLGQLAHYRASAVGARGWIALMALLAHDRLLG